MGDRILTINDFSVVTLNLAEVYMLLSQCDSQTTFTIEYDISVIGKSRSRYVSEITKLNCFEILLQLQCEIPFIDTKLHCKFVHISDADNMLWRSNFFY